MSLLIIIRQLCGTAASIGWNLAVLANLYLRAEQLVFGDATTDILRPDAFGGHAAQFRWHAVYKQARNELFSECHF